MSNNGSTASPDAAVSGQTPLSPEKSLFGNSANLLRESDIEALISTDQTNEPQSSSNKPSIDVTKPSEPQKPAEEPFSQDVLPETDDEAESADVAPAPDANDAAATKPVAVDDVIDKAGEEKCVKRHVEPMYEENNDNEEKATEAQKIDESVKEKTESNDEPGNEDAEVVEEEAEVIEEEAEVVEKEAEVVEKEAEVVEEEAEVVEEPVEEEPRSRRRATRSVKVPPPPPITKSTPKRGPKKNIAKEESEPKESVPDSEEKETPEQEAEATNAPAEVEAESEAEEKTPRRRSTRVTKPVVSTPTPVKTPGRGRGRPPKAKPETAATEPTESESEPSPKKTRGRKKKSPVPVESEDEEEPMELDEEVPVEEPTPTRRGRSARIAATPKKTPAKRGPKPKKAASDDLDSQTETDVQTESEAGQSPRRRLANKPTPKRTAKMLEDMDEANIEKEESPGPSSSKTPKRGAVKRPAPSGSTSRAKRGRHRRSISGDPNDPYDFDAKQDDHPILFDNVNVQRSNFMSLKFFQSKNNTDTSSRYAALEKNASERRSMLPALLANSTPTSLKTSRKAVTKKTPATSRKRTLKTEGSENGDETLDEEVLKKTPRKRANVASKPEEVKEVPPSISSEEQQRVDGLDHFESGMRVYAFWEKKYYSAILAEKDGLSRWKVFYTEDNSKSFVPFNSIMALNLISVGTEVSVLGEADDDGFQDVFEGKVVSVPNIKDVDEWHAGIFSVEVQNEENPPEVRDIRWNNIFFTDTKFKLLRKDKKNATFIDSENVIGERRTRRSCVTTPAAPPVTATPKARGKAPKKTLAKATVVREPSIDTIKDEHEQSVVSEISNGGAPIFTGKTFILTAATRRETEPPFHKKSLKRQIEHRGGRVVENLTEVTDPATAYIIADTFYRTSKYLGALSMSIPPVSFKWILESIESDLLKDPLSYQLPAGLLECSDDVVPFRPSKNVLGGLRVAVYNWCPRENMSFRDVWAPIVTNLGGVCVQLPDNVPQAVSMLKTSEEPIDYVVVEEGADVSIIDAAYEVDATPVRADWLTHAVVAGKIDNTDLYFISRDEEDDAEFDADDV